MRVTMEWALGSPLTLKQARQPQQGRPSRLAAEWRTGVGEVLGHRDEHTFDTGRLARLAVYAARFSIASVG